MTTKIIEYKVLFNTDIATSLMGRQPQSIKTFQRGSANSLFRQLFINNGYTVESSSSYHASMAHLIDGEYLYVGIVVEYVNNIAYDLLKADQLAATYQLPYLEIMSENPEDTSIDEISRKVRITVARKMSREARERAS